MARSTGVLRSDFGRACTDAVAGLFSRGRWAIATAFLLSAVSPQASLAQMMTLPGSFAVNETGAATYSVPIAVPPGTAGMSTSLTLSYSSQGANGIVGVGWSLDGLPSIGRCPRTWAQDGFPGAVNYDANDRFCFEGQRLITISGSYGADGAEYRTEIDSYNKIISHGTEGTGPAWFEVRTKSGQVMEFGHTADSQVLAQGKATTRSWAVNKVSDTKANYFTVTYINDTTNGQAYPSRVDYTGNTTANVAPFNSVQFVYATRPDITPQYQAGSLSQTTVRLTNVQTFSGATLVGDYRLTYQQSPADNRSEVVSIATCTGSGICLPPTQFSWQTATSAAGTFTLRTNNIGPNFGSPPSTYTSIVGDFNGDGKTDYAMVGGSVQYVFLGKGDGSFTLRTNNLGPNFGSPPSAYAAIVGDFNGDGKADYALVGGAVQYVFLGNGDGSFGLVTNNLAANFGSPPAAYAKIVGDFNGDGKTDYVLVGGAVQYVFLSNGDGTFALTSNAVAANFGSPSAAYTPIVGDFNGDGKTDFALVGGAVQYVFLSKGDGTFTFGSNNVGANFGSPPAAYMPIVGDFNGDGKTDYALIGGATQYVFLSKGDGTFALSSNNIGANFGSPPSAYAPIGGDFNGDGNTDYALVGGAVQYVFLSNGAPASIVTITNGQGAAIAIGYLPLTNASVYSKDSAAVYPLQDTQAPIYVVSRVDSSNGLGGTYSSSYAYAGAKMDLSGRGFLGFRQMTTTDLQTSIVQTTTYRQDFPYIGLVGTTTTMLNTLTLNQTTNGFQFSNASGGASLSAPTVAGAPYRASVAQRVAQSVDLDGSTIPTATTSYQYDAYGNATQVVVSTPDGFSKTTANTYTNDTARWLLGRLTASSVTSVAP